MPAEYAIVGYGVTEIGRVDEPHSLIEYETEAAARAIADAGLQRSDIGAALQAVSDLSGSVRTRHDDSYARVLGLPANVYIENVGRGGEHTAMALIIAMKLLDLGIANYVLVAGARDDFSRSRRVKRAGGRGTGQLHPPKEGAWGRANGCATAASFHSHLATRHMAVYGTTPEQLGSVAVSQRAWANRNPEATMHTKAMSLDEYLEMPFIIWPYRVPDFSLQSDGGIAFIVTTRDRARDTNRPVYVRGVGFGEQSASQWWDKKNYSELAVATARDCAFRQAGVSLGDVDFAQLYDCFTAEVLIQLEDYGWCGKGEGGAFVAAGNTAPGGAIPVNTGGGLLSGYHLGNLTGTIEAIRQLRGECGTHQVAGARVGTVSGHGGELVAGYMCSIHSTVVLSSDAD
jgi:acetyl-CoA acetyltransferase